ncbi:primosomal protein N' (replication factor Y) - superfamily II helicase [Palleronia abyssalis]|uniref:Primosomal protein N' (Replication factor Y)-superfamily II helicase n=1 Tax=Palleronia abyssalis TaxID=1501240 RepID=A0A2R8BUH2_9RHOB|nr:primosomal protein N' (replication factor Y) - superfamily II helicase [Palleronia abyssalis]SPJ23809.1 hypothetical protein PAA8504_01627 [Palleronia abyssalis]
MSRPSETDDDAPDQPSDEGHHFPCPSCGADLRFEPTRGALHCDFCGHEEELAPDPAPQAIRELDFEAALSNRIPQMELEVARTHRCPNCGAEVTFDTARTAMECPFCATPVVTDPDPHQQIRPRALLPFALTEDQARRDMTAWLGGLWFAPNGLRRFARKGRRMSGVYLPYWTFDARTRSAYRGQRGRVHRTRRRGADGKTRTDMTIRWTRVSGTVARDFDDVLALASPTLPGKTVDAIEPWDLSALVPYSADYLAGFGAESYRIGVEDGHRIARGKMDAVIARDVRLDIGGDRQRIDRIDTEIADVTFKHILLPLWIAAYTYRGRTFRVVINGHNGRVTGERPYSPWKIAFAVLVAVIVAGVFAYFSNG